MKKEKVLLIFIALLAILAICIIAILTLNEKRKDEIISNEYEKYMDTQIVDKLTNVVSRNDFYAVQSCVEQFYTNYSEIFDEKYLGYLIQTEEDKLKIKAKRANKVYTMLDEEYLEYESITSENLISKLPEIKYTSILIKDMSYIEKDDRISVYFVSGTRSGTLNSKAVDFLMMVKVDNRNRSFKISLGEYAENQYKTLQNGQDIEIKQNEIENEIYNIYTYEHITESEYIKDLFMHYKKALRINKEYSYSLVDEEYKKISFENMEEYLSYLDTNYAKIAMGSLEEYNTEENTSYTEYVFKDSNGRYYIFKETAPFKYTVQPDDYTIATDDFIKTYKNSTDGQKLVIIIKRFFMGINDKNYGYSYGLLADSFKNNKYPTKNDFVNYAKQNFFDENEVEYISYKKENGVYIYKIKISDATGKNLEEKLFNILIRLNSGTDFEMSFSEN